MQVRSRIETDDPGFGFEPINYYNALYGSREVRVGPHTVERVPLGRHFLLQRLEKGLEQLRGADCVPVLADILETVGVCLEDLTVNEVAVVLRVARGINQRTQTVAWEVFTEPDQRTARAVDYTGRELGYIVHLLASTYHWMFEDILELPVEVAYAHVQEALLHRRSEREWTYYLSDRAWEYDPGAKASKYRPLPPVPWDVDRSTKTYEPVPEHIKEKYWPKGVVIDLSKGVPDVERAGSDSGSASDNEAPNDHTAVDPSPAQDRT
jgi:hypothetical protein